MVWGQGDEAGNLKEERQNDLKLQWAQNGSHA